MAEPKDIKYFKKDLEKAFSSLEVGIFKEIPRKIASDKEKGFKKFGSSLARKVDKKNDVVKNSDLLKKADLKYRILSMPINQNNTDLQKFFEIFIDNTKSKNKKDINKIKNGYKAVFIKPIMQQKYGVNSPKTVENKGFNKLLVDTSQMLKNLNIRVNKQDIY